MDHLLILLFIIQIAYTVKRFIRNIMCLAFGISTCLKTHIMFYKSNIHFVDKGSNPVSQERLQLH